MQRSAKQAEASRPNGSQSRGPKTEAGRRRSSANSIRHGLLAKCAVPDCEPKDTFKTVLGYHIQTENCQTNPRPGQPSANQLLEKYQTNPSLLVPPPVDPEAPIVPNEPETSLTLDVAITSKMPDEPKDRPRRSQPAMLAIDHRGDYYER